jgi:hypothetical protein
MRDRVGGLDYTRNGAKENDFPTRLVYLSLAVGAREMVRPAVRLALARFMSSTYVREMPDPWSKARLRRMLLENG